MDQLTNGSKVIKGVQVSEELVEMIRQETERLKPFMDVFKNDEVKRFLSIQQKLLASIKEEAHFLEQKPNIKEKISAIGILGWTALPGTKFESYLDCPTNTSQMADDYFMKLMDDNAVKALFSEIMEISDETDDVNEAIHDYNDGRYKSSTMVMFGLIDAILIKSNDNELQGKRYVPQKWGTKFYIDIKNEIRFHDLHLTGITEALMEFFDNKKKFSYSEHVINRNVLVHGMLRRKVSKKDCLQVFLLYRNLLKYIIDVKERFFIE